MAANTCTGPLRDLDTGEWFCPEDARYCEFQDTEDWQERCETCRAGRERAEELRGDMQRDEG